MLFRSLILIASIIVQIFVRLSLLNLCLLFNSTPNFAFDFETELIAGFYDAFSLKGKRKTKLLLLLTLRKMLVAQSHHIRCISLLKMLVASSTLLTNLALRHLIALDVCLVISTYSVDLTLFQLCL